MWRVAFLYILWMFSLSVLTSNILQLKKLFFFLPVLSRVTPPQRSAQSTCAACAHVYTTLRTRVLSGNAHILQRRLPFVCSARFLVSSSSRINMILSFSWTCMLDSNTRSSYLKNVNCLICNYDFPNKITEMVVTKYHISKVKIMIKQSIAEIPWLEIVL